MNEYKMWKIIAKIQTIVRRHFWKEIFDVYYLEKGYLWYQNN